MARKKAEKEKPSLLGSIDLLKISEESLNDLVIVPIAFNVGKNYELNVAVKRLSYDEIVDLTKGKSLDKMLMADLFKLRVLATIYDAETQKPMFESIEQIGKKVAPPIVDALYKASDSVNDYTGKLQPKSLTTKQNSSANLSAAESEDQQLSKQEET